MFGSSADGSSGGTPPPKIPLIGIFVSIIGLMGIIIVAIYSR